MTTPNKIQANRRNAARSTGPRTPEGKARSSKNAMRHGLLSRETLVLGENEEDLVAFRRRLRADLSPSGELEEFLFDKVVSAAWRLRRATRVEAALFDRNRHPTVYDEGEETRGPHTALYHGGSEFFTTLARYEAALERSFYRALHELQRAQEIRARRCLPAPRGRGDKAAISAPFGSSVDRSRANGARYVPTGT